jgi:pimeloyl-ACP methyl ester carboxylesterase
MRGSQFPKLALDLARITTPTLLVHGTADTDVKPEYSEHALAQIPGAEILRVKDGTHVAAYTDPTSDDVHARIAQFLRR